MICRGGAAIIEIIRRCECAKRFYNKIARQTENESHESLSDGSGQNGNNGVDKRLVNRARTRVTLLSCIIHGSGDPPCSPPPFSRPRTLVIVLQEPILPMPFLLFLFRSAGRSRIGTAVPSSRVSIIRVRIRVYVEVLATCARLSITMPSDLNEFIMLSTSRRVEGAPGQVILGSLGASWGNW